MVGAAIEKKCIIHSVILLTLFSLIAHFFIAIYSYIPNSQQFDKLHNIAEEHNISGRVGAFSLSNNRNLLFITAYDRLETGSAENSMLYRVEIDSNTSKKIALDGGNYITESVLYIDHDDTLYTMVADSTNDSKYIYTYSADLVLQEKIPFIYDHQKVRDFVKTGLKGGILLGDPHDYSPYVLINNNGKSIGTTGAYLIGVLENLSVTTIGATLSFDSSVQTQEDNKNRTRSETRTRTYHDSDKTLTIIEQCETGSFSGFGCLYSTTHVTDDVIDIKFINKYVTPSQQEGIYDSKGRAIFLVNKKLFATKKNQT